MIKVDTKRVTVRNKAKRGNYSEAEKTELMNIPTDSNLTLELKAKAASWNRDFDNVRRMYYRVQTQKNSIIQSSEKESNSIIPKRTVKAIEETKGASRTNVSMFNRFTNAWTKEEDDIILAEIGVSSNKKKTAEELMDILETRTAGAIIARYHLLKNKSQSSFIPEVEDKDPFLTEVTTQAYKSLDGEFYFNKTKAIQSNVRFILDSMPDSNASDRTMHEWFNQNKEKVNYLANLNANELW